MSVPQPLQQLCNILKAIANMEGQQNSDKNQTPLIDKSEAKEIALGIARLVDEKSTTSSIKTVVDSEELARQVDADFTCFLCRKRCRTKSRFLSHFRSHFRTSVVKKRSAATSVETSDEEISHEETPLHLRGLSKDPCHRMKRRKKKTKKNDLSRLTKSGNQDVDIDSGCHSIDDGFTSSAESSSAFSDCPGDSESSDSENGEKKGLLKSQTNQMVTIKDRLSLAEKQLDNNETEGLICLTCLKRFSNCQNLRRHLRLHIARDSATPDIERNTSRCDDEFDGRYFCDWCPARFENRSAARVHENTHKGQETKCYICDKIYADRYSLRYHLRTHGIGRQIRCEYCNKSFSKPSRLEAHIRAQHDNIRDFECSECGKKFKTRVHLKNHARRHSGERPFACSVCGDKFRHKASMVAHMRSHEGARPYCCEICGKTFREPSTLKAHCRVHTGDKPYHCNLCEKSFTQRAGLNYHRKSHEQVKDAEKALTSTNANSTTLPPPLPSPPVQSGDAVFQVSPLPSFNHLRSISPSSSPSSSSMCSEPYTYSLEKPVVRRNYSRDVTPPQTPPSSSCSPPMTSAEDFAAIAALGENNASTELLPNFGLQDSIGHQLDYSQQYYVKNNYQDDQQHYRQQVCHQQNVMSQHQWFQNSYHLQHQSHQTSYSGQYDFNQAFDFNNANYSLINQHQHLHATGMDQFNLFTGPGYNNNYGQQASLSTQGHHQPGYCL